MGTSLIRNRSDQNGAFSAPIHEGAGRRERVKTCDRIPRDLHALNLGDCRCELRTKVLRLRVEQKRERL
jgi:hypothetical protein